MRDFLLMFAMIICGNVYAQTVNSSQPSNLEEGMTYIEESRQGIPSSITRYGRMIAGTCEIAGKEAMQVWAINPDTKEKLYVVNYIYTEGSKAYMLGKKDADAEEEWFLLYDFALQPGDIMEGYTFWSLYPDKLFYKCLSVGPNTDPRYNGLLTITFATAHPDCPDEWYENQYNQWLVGIGSVQGLEIPALGDLIGAPAYELMEASKGDEILFSLTAEVENISQEDTLPAVYGIDGMQRHCTSLPSGIYIIRDGNSPRKIRVK